MDTVSLADAKDVLDRLKGRIGENIFGQEELVEEALCCLIAGGHILVTGAPGLAKTTLVRVIAREIGLQFGRVQFTPDLLPSDITGSQILTLGQSAEERKFVFEEGPIFTNLLLADEINRASPRTQSALLEAMQERFCTIGGQRHRLPQPFLVFATQNPFESEGTFPLPEAQLDRFLIHSLVDYPSSAAEEEILKAHASRSLSGEKVEDDSAKSEPLMDANMISQLMDRAERVAVDDQLLHVIATIVRSTRPQETSNTSSSLRDAIWYGAGPRAGIALVSTSRALAMMEGEEQVRWRHIKRLVKPVIRHRLRLTAQAIHDGYDEDRLLDEVIQETEERYTSSLRD